MGAAEAEFPNIPPAPVPVPGGGPAGVVEKKLLGLLDAGVVVPAAALEAPKGFCAPLALVPEPPPRLNIGFDPPPPVSLDPVLFGVENAEKNEPPAAAP